MHVLLIKCFCVDSCRRSVILISLQKPNTLPALTLKEVKMCLCNDCYYSKYDTQMENYLLYLIPDL